MQRRRLLRSGLLRSGLTGALGTLGVVALFPIRSLGPNQLFCPCHQSAFDVLAAGEMVFGPAARRLPQLPLGIDEEGFVVA